jgi:hypothetical protein
MGATLAELGAATRYVTKSGSDTNDGSSLTSAYLTLQKGLRAMAPGDQLCIGGGAYAEALLNAIPSGTSESTRTVVTNLGHENVIIRPAAGPARVVEFTGAACWITIAANGPGEIVLDGANVSHNVVKFSAPSAGGAGDWPSHIRLQNLEIRHSHDSGILGYPRRCEFIGLEIHHAGTTVFDHGMYLAGTDNVIEDCNIHDNYARGIQIFMSGKHQDPGFASRNIVRQCRIHHNGLTPGKLKPGIDADSGTANQIYNNLIYANGQFGVMVQIGGAGNVVCHNTFFANGTAAVFIKSSAGPGTIVRNNLAAGHGTGPQFVDERGDALADHNAWTDADPHFASTDPADPKFLQLTPASTSAIDQGVAEALSDLPILRDIRGKPRPHGSAPDLGADEYVP